MMAHELNADPVLIEETADSAVAVRYRECRDDWASGSKRDGMAG